MNSQYPDRLAPVLEGDSLSCPSCGHGPVQTTLIEHKFPYGDGQRAVELSATLPLRRCLECGIEFFDSLAEDLQHEAVCRHLGVVTPSEVRAVRQNAANDQLLYLLTFPENLVRLRDRIEKTNPVAMGAE